MNSYSNENQLCQCQNQNLLAEGSECEICNGWIPVGASAQKNIERSEKFDQSYFELIEVYASAVTHAA